MTLASIASADSDVSIDTGQNSATVTISDDEFIIDLSDNPPQDPGPYNMSRDEVLVACQMAFKSVTRPCSIPRKATCNLG